MALDRVKPLKIESTDTGGDENDAFPTSLDPQEDYVEARGIVLDDSSHADESTVIWRDDTNLKFKDGENSSGFTLTELAAGGGGGITESQHEDLDTIVHEIDETSYDEVTYAGGSVTTYTVWTTSGKTKKIREETYTYSGGRVTQAVTKQYDADGVLKMTMTESYTYANGKVATVTRTKS